jgi:hypothetical protein
VQVFDLLNYAAVLILIVQLYIVLRRYRFSQCTAALASFLALIVNVAILRTLIYRQINIFVLNLILLALTAYGVSAPLSAAALGLAVQLKVSPLVLVLVFVYLRDWRWLGWFVGSQLLIFVGTSVATSPAYYAQFFSQLAGLHETATRNLAVDVVLYNVVNFLPTALATPLRTLEGPVASALRIVLVGFTLATAVRLAHRARLTPVVGRARVLLNGFVVLPIAMLLGAPSIWEHHFVFVLLTALVLLPALEKPWQVRHLGDRLPLHVSAARLRRVPTLLHAPGRAAAHVGTAAQHCAYETALWSSSYRLTRFPIRARRRGCATQASHSHHHPAR